MAMDSRMRSLVNKAKQRVANAAGRLGNAVSVGAAVGKKEGVRKGVQAFKNNVEPEDSGERTLGGFGPKTPASIRKGQTARNARQLLSKEAEAYAKNPMAKRFRNVDPKKFGYPEDKTVRIRRK